MLTKPINFQKKKTTEKEPQKKSIACMIREIFNMLNQYALDNPTLPVNQRFSHLFKILAECQAVLWECRAATMGRQIFGIRMVYRETPQESNPTSPHVMSECQTPALDQICQSGPSSRCEDCFSTEQNHPEYPIQKKGQSGGNGSSKRRPFLSRKTDCSPDLRALGPTILSRTMPTYSLSVYEMMIFRNSIRNWMEFYCL